MTYWTYLSFEQGFLKIEGDSKEVTKVSYVKKIQKDSSKVPSHLMLCKDELTAYLAGELTDFKTPFSLRGTEFQNQVWQVFLDIPYGKTRSYKEVALLLGDEKLSRAVGSAAGSNPIMILVPCHRIIGSNGHLTGYAGGMEVKMSLLNLENPRMSLGIQGSLF